MDVHVQLFSILRECLPEGSQRGRGIIALQEGSRLRDLFDALNLKRCLSDGKDFAEQLDSWQISLNGEFLDDIDIVLEEGDQVIVFPHMAGG